MAVSSIQKRRQAMQDERASLKLRSEESKHKEMRLTLEIIVRNHPEAASKAVEYLWDIGYSEEAVGQPATKKSKQAQAVDARKGRQPAGADEQRNMFPDLKPEDLVPAARITISDLKVNELRDKILSQMGTAAFSVPNLNAYAKKRAARGGTKTEFLRILDVATGIPESMPIEGGLRVWENLAAYVFKCALLNSPLLFYRQKGVLNKTLRLSRRAVL